MASRSRYQFTLHCSQSCRRPCVGMGNGGFINPKVADLYINRNWLLDDTLRRIFIAANITMSVRMEGRSRKSVVASFHSLRHTFVSLSANAGVPLPVVQSIVGHCSTAMTRHYYHENLDALRRAVEAIPAVGHGEWGTGNGDGKGKREDVAVGGSQSSATDASSSPIPHPPSPARRGSVPARLARLARYFAKGLLSKEEYAATRTRILAEI
ncbi:MAG: tyrosine-type recombinase/integrase [Victivallales bacterium]|nr:tyrosine-type recombinase/integrase [Victivallales bacterium]